MKEFAVRATGLAKQFFLRHQQPYYRFTEFIENVARNTMHLPSKLMQSRRHQESREQGVESVDHDSFWAVSDVSFTVKPGEVLGIIGRNGAGKSTLLKLLSRITRPTRGRIETVGRISSLLEVGTGFHPELTGRENIFLNGAILGMTRSEVRRKFDEIVAFAETEKFLDTQVKHYSSGMQMRLAFAVAAHLEPEILIIDEVLAVGDAAFQKKCLGRMGDAVESGRTILFVSHNMSAIRSLSHRVIWMENGRVRHEGPAGEVIDRYLNDLPEIGRERSWESRETSPGDERVRLCAVRVLSDEDDVTSFTVRTEVRIEHSIQVDALMECFNLSFVLYNIDGTCVFNSTSTAADFSPGRYRMTLDIPGDFLNDGVYRIRVLLVEQSRVIVDLWDLVEFEVRDVERVGGWFGKWEGVVRPKLPWRTDREISE